MEEGINLTLNQSY